MDNQTLEHFRKQSYGCLPADYKKTKAPRPILRHRWIRHYRVCKTENWTPVSSHAFQTRALDLLAQLFKTTHRNDITRNGKAVRGFKNVALA